MPVDKLILAVKSLCRLKTFQINNAPDCILHLEEKIAQNRLSQLNEKEIKLLSHSWEDFIIKFLSDQEILARNIEIEFEAYLQSLN